MTRIIIYSVNTGVVILAVSTVARLEYQKIVVAFSSQPNFRFIDTNAVFMLFGPQEVFANKGEKLAIKTWIVCDYSEEDVKSH